MQPRYAREPGRDHAALGLGAALGALLLRRALREAEQDFHLAGDEAARILTGAVRLHHHPVSPYVRKVMVAAHELGLASSIELIPTTQDSVVADVAADNPLGRIPTLITEAGASSMKDMGKVMALVKERHAAAIEPARASALVKAALASAVRYLAAELGPAGILCNAVNFSMLETDAARREIGIARVVGRVRAEHRTAERDNDLAAD